jgi:hypothetical protein
MADLHFVVPPGIGDISWIYSKVKTLAQQRSVAFSICNDLPHRSQPFVDLLPHIENLGYDKLPYWKAFSEALPSSARLGDLSSGRYILTLNTHLESGKKLAEAYPGQPTDYHYGPTLPMLPIEPAGPRLKALLSGSRRVIGVYCSSYGHREDILFWKVNEWMEFLVGVKSHLPDVRFAVIGAPYDDRTAEVGAALRAAGEDPLLFLDQPIGFTFQVLKALDYFFAFPSGLGILADVLDVPAMMWFWGNLPNWGHVKGLFGAYADPAHVESGFHLMAPYATPRESLDLWLQRGIQFVRAREA